MGRHPYAEFGMPMSKKKDDLAQTIYNFLILRPKDKVIQRSWIYVTHCPWTLGDTLMCQIWYDYVKGQKSCGPNTKPCQNPYKIDLEVKGQCCIGIINISNTSDPCAKYDMPMSKQTEVTSRTWRLVKNPINLTLRSKVNVVSGSWMYVTHCLMVIQPCVKYSMSMSKQKMIQVGHESAQTKILIYHPPPPKFHS